MDLLSDIVEKEVEAPVDFQPHLQASGFPKPKKSAWAQKREIKKEESKFKTDAKTGLKRLPKEQQKLNYDNLSESEKIHLENIEILSNMTEEERMKEKQELFDTLDPKILKALLLRSEKKQKNKDMEFQGYGEWIGGDKEGRDYAEWKRNTLDKEEVDKALGVEGSPKKVRFDELTKVQYPEEVVQEEWEDVEEIAPPSYQINKEADEIPVEESIKIHFPKPVNTEELKLDINDPDFNEKLHERFFPELPKDIEKLKWMEQVPEIDTSNLIFDDVSQLRFDFNSDLLLPWNNNDVSPHKGLHHHSENPSLAGYNLSELSHLARSSIPGQRCIAIRTLGRILYKLGKGKYNIIPEFVPDEEDEEIVIDEEAIEQSSIKFDQMFWGLIDELRIIETLEECADEQETHNLSVRNYAIDALWLWKQGGGNKRHAN